MMATALLLGNRVNGCCHDLVIRFDYYGIMEPQEIVLALTALAQVNRLSAFRLLINAGQEGMSAGKIAEALNMPASSLSFHLKELHHAGLLKQRQQGRFVIYTANYDRMKALLSYLTENCCNGKPC